MINRITYRGRTMSITDWAKEIGIKRDTLTCRIAAGWDIERAMTAKVRDPHDERGPRKSDEQMTAPYRHTKVDGKIRTKHSVIAERILGKPLPKDAVVHHVNYNRLDNRPSNLVICPDRKYHNLLHLRTDALNACGKANFRRCPFCGKYDDPANMRQYSGERTFLHDACRKLRRGIYQR